jgi:2-polyprenyl-3-methyl-5-hydroxy-6-metoxy-1,4-benzoquinol methylase
METNSAEYKEHLEEKYLPGRDMYLNTFFYPKIMRQFSNEAITDLGFGTGAFLRYLKSKGRDFAGIDSNPHLVKLNRDAGFKVEEDDVTVLRTITQPMKNAICDNVLEHLDMQQIDSFFKVCREKFAKGGTLVVIVPDVKGYQRDPTHKTFVTEEIVRGMCQKHAATLRSYFCHPFNWRPIGRILYLNMQVFVIKY